MPFQNHHQPCTFYVARHGETEWNVQRIVQGKKDSPLTKQGVQQAKQLAQKLQNIPFDGVYSSDLQRAYRTAQIIAADTDLVVKTSHYLQESDFGRFNGKKSSFFLKQLQESIRYRESLSNEEYLTYKLAPDMESYQETASRTLRYLRQLALANQGKTLLIISHGGVIRALLLKLGYANNKQIDHSAVKNTAYIKLESDGLDFVVKDTVGITVNLDRK